MDGIFGVGLAEVLIVGLALFVVGGPKNTAKWARDLGRLVRQVRQMWDQMLAELESDLGPEGKELVDAARELGQGARDVTSMANPSRMVGETLRMVETAVDVKEDNNAGDATQPAAPPESDAPAQAAPEEPAASDNKYAAWRAPETQTQ